MKRLALLTLTLLLLTGANLAADPSDDEAIRELVRSMAKVGGAWGPTFSPDGSEIAFLTNISGSPQVWRLPVEGGYPEMVTNLDDPVGGVEWSPGGEWLAISVAPGGGMNAQIFVVRPDGTDLRRLTAGGKDNNWLAEWMSDSSAIGISSNVEEPGAMHSYLLSLDGELELVAKNKGIGWISDLSSDGKSALVGRLVSRGSNDLFLVDLESSEEVHLTPHEGPGSFSGQLAPDGRTVYLATNKDRDLIAFGRVTVDAGSASSIEILAERTDAELAGFQLDDAARTAILAWNVAGRNEVEIYDLPSGDRRPVADLPAETIGEGAFSPDGSLYVFSASGAAHPTDLYVLDVESGEVVRRLTKSPHPGVDLDELIRPELIRYEAHDGLELSGWLYRARGVDGPGPVVMSFHGGPEGQERPRFRSDYQALLARGISVFAPNVRGSSGFGKEFVNLDNRALRVDAIADIESTIEWLVESGTADPDRIGIMGGSYGGYMVMAGLAEYPERIAAGANLFGVVNFKTFFEHSEPWMAAISKDEYGDPDTEAEMLARLSPINKVDRVISPTIVLHGANDTNVPVIEAEQVVESLEAREIPVKYILFPDEGHGWRKTENRITSTVEIVNWFSEHLGGD
ncbi:MAG: S9 family peptidase [Thermoanaerobaculia bacterium]|nr:S9 family peptidase [Thermoanaerobaculia bacterium]